MAESLYNESMSLACQRGQCEDCPDADATGFAGCSCTCHIPDNSGDEYADELAQAWYENYYGTATA